MTDTEIIKALECCGRESCNGCPYRTDRICHQGNPMIRDALDLINRQKAKIEKFEKRQKPTAASGYKIENDKVVFFTNMLGGCKIVKDNLEEVVKTLNELLHEAYSKDEILFHYRCALEDLKTAKAEAIKEFAERLKERTISFAGVVEQREVIDNLIKEMIGEQ